MSQELVCVQDTEYSEYFENAAENTIFLLAEKLAESTWNTEICVGTSSYFDLPDDCWIISSKSVSIGRWIEAYNNNDNSLVESFLRDAVDWLEDSFVMFFANNKIVFKVKWLDFLRYWDDFIAVDDDCPIILPENGKGKKAILFRPIGDIQKIG